MFQEVHRQKKCVIQKYVSNTPDQFLKLRIISQEPPRALSQCSLHNAPIFRLLLKVAVNGTHQCESLNFCGTLVPTMSLLPCVVSLARDLHVTINSSDLDICMSQPLLANHSLNFIKNTPYQFIGFKRIGFDLLMCLDCTCTGSLLQ